MGTIEIPREAWAERLKEFTLLHEHWLVSLEILGESGDQTAIRDLPLLGVTPDRVDHDRAVVISMGRTAEEHVSHMIEDVRRIVLHRRHDGADAALELESADGTKTILRFRAAALPETVDGLVRFH